MPAVFNQSSGISLGEGRNRGRATPPDIQLSSTVVSPLWGCTCMLLCCWRTDSTAGHGVQTNSQHTGPSLALSEPRLPLHALSPHLIPNFSASFCISSKTPFWIFTPKKPGEAGGGSDACFWLVVEGGGGWDAVHAAVQPFSSSLPQGTVLLGAASPRGARTGLHHCPIRLGSWVSSQLIQKTPGTCALSHAQPCCPLHMRLHHCRCRGTLLVAEIVSEPEIQTQERQHRVPFVSAEGKCQQADANLPSHCTACNLQPHPCGAGTAAGLLATSIPRTESSTHSPAICRQQLTACSTHVQKNITNQAFCNKPGFLQQA